MTTEGEWYECTSPPYTEEVCRHITQRVMDEMYNTLSTSPHILSDYYLFSAHSQEHFDTVWSHTFPRGGQTAGPFTPNSPPRNSLETRVRELPTKGIDARRPP